MVTSAITKNLNLGHVEQVTGTFVMDHSLTKLSYVQLRQNLGSKKFYDLAPIFPDASLDLLRKIRTVSKPVNTLFFQQEISLSAVGRMHESTDYSLLSDIAVISDIKSSNIKIIGQELKQDSY